MLTPSLNIEPGLFRHIRSTNGSSTTAPPSSPSAPSIRQRRFFFAARLSGTTCPERHQQLRTWWQETRDKPRVRGGPERRAGTT